MAYLKERVASEEYKKALMERHPLMNTAISNAAAQSMWATGSTSITNVPLAISPKGEGFMTTNPMSHFQVERVDNGFVLRSGNKAKVCKDMEELSQQFIAIMVEQQLDK